MIRSFRHSGLRRLFERGDHSRLRAEMLDKIENILLVLNRAGRPGDMDLPGFRLHPLRGDRAGQWAVTVKANWRIVWRFDDGDVTDVDLLDYH